MDTKKALILAKNNIWLMILVGMLAASLSFFLLLAKEKRFKAGSDVLVIQNSENFVDSYTLSKSAEYLTRVLMESIYSDTFIREVRNSSPNSLAFLPTDKKQMLKTWEKTVKTSADSNLGVLSLEVFADSQKEALNISEGVLKVLTEKNSMFRGGSQNIEVRILNGPVVEKNPEAKNLLAITIAGFLLGMAIVFIFVYLKEIRQVEHLNFTGKESFKDFSENEQDNFVQKSAPLSENYDVEPTKEEMDESLNYWSRR